MTEPKNGNAKSWAEKLLLAIFGAAVSLLIALNGIVLAGQQEVGEQGRKNADAIERIDETLSARALADRTKATEERRVLERQVFDLQGQQRRERQTQEPAGVQAPSGE